MEYLFAAAAFGPFAAEKTAAVKSAAAGPSAAKAAAVVDADGGTVSAVDERRTLGGPAGRPNFFLLRWVPGPEGVAASVACRSRQRYS